MADASARDPGIRDGTGRGAAAQAAHVIACAMGFRACTPSLPDGGDCDWLGNGEKSVAHKTTRSERELESGETVQGHKFDWLGGGTVEPESGSQVAGGKEPSTQCGLLWF